MTEEKDDFQQTYINNIDSVSMEDRVKLVQLLI
jgi:hypothetical protein